MSAPDPRPVVLHFAEEGDTSGYFPQIARWHDRDRYRMLFGTLRPMAPWLRDFMGGQGVDTFSCECRGRPEYPLGLLRLLGYLRARRVELLHTHLFDPSVVGLAAGKLAGTPVRFMTRHYSDYHTRIQKRWHTRLDQLCTSLCHRVIAVSEATARVMREEEGAPPERIRVVLNGIDFDRLRLSSPEAPACLRSEFAPAGEALLLQVARLHAEKGHEHLFRALPEIEARLGRPVRLLLAGTGSAEETYRRRIAELGLENKVRLLGFRKDVPDLIAAADAMVLPSVAEAFGLVLTEALYLGTPVVATTAGGIPEIVTDGRDGLLVPPADPEALAAAVVRVLQDACLRERFTAAGRETARRFSFERMMRAYEAQYDDFLRGRA